MEKIKVLFPQRNDDGEIVVESIWCTKNGEVYTVDNIPFVAKRISLGDTITVEYDEEENAYYFDDFVDVSGNTTIRIYFFEKEVIDSVRKDIESMSCESEAFLERNLIAVNVPYKVNYTAVKAYLEKGEQLDKWTYEESCLAHNY